MAISAADAEKLNNSGVIPQDIQLGTELLALQTAITNLQAGVGITLPTSEPATAGSLWADTLVVTVSDGT